LTFSSLLHLRDKILLRNRGTNILTSSAGQTKPEAAHE
jgi:hypothetical protein